jgi:hypothetical protein
MISSRPLEAISQMQNSTDPYNDTFTITTTTTTISCETHAIADTIKKTTVTGTMTPMEALITMTPAMKTADSITETMTYKSMVSNVTNHCRTKIPTKTCKGMIPITTTVPTTPITIALNKAHPHLPLKLGLYTSSCRTKIGR